jgi:2-polyprenyl-3-methyl-5-hydroxy-6-metoxy-1,4-benzoquinol methylase
VDVRLLERIRRHYEGEAGRRWERIELGDPATYPEENVVIGRSQAQERLLEWIDPPQGKKILDGGCGMGSVASALARRGARVTGVDLVPRFVDAAREREGPGGPDFVLGSFLDVLEGGDFDALLLMGVLEDYTFPERRNLLEAIGASGIPLVWLVFRRPGSGLLWRLIPDSGSETIDPIELLRWIHLNIPYRQARQETIRVRNFHAHLSELVLAEPAERS